MNKKRNIFIFFLIMTCIIFTACGKDEVVKEEDVVEVESTKDEAVILNLEGGDWGYPNPYAHYSRGPGAYKMRLIFDSLLERGEEGMIPWLAKSYEVSEDGKEYIFNLVEDVKWQDGEEFSAEDVKFTFDYYKEHPPVSDDLQRADNDYINSIEVLDDNTIKIVVKEKDATLLERFGSARIIPKHIWEKVEDPNTFIDKESVIGCGPYILEDYEKEQGAYKFIAFDNYWGGNQRASEINFVPVSDPILAFESSEIDICEVNPDIIDKYESDDDMVVVKNPAFWGYKLLLNMEKREELLDKNLRQAIYYAIDVDELIEKVGRGAGKKASAGYLPLEHSFYNSDVKKYDRDIEAAKKLLDNKEYSFEMLTGNSNEEVRIAEIIKMNLEEVGIKLNITSLDKKSRDAKVKEGDYELALNGHGGWGNDPDLLSKQVSGKSIKGYKNADIDKLLKEQRSEINEDARREIVDELQVLISEELPVIPLYNTVGYTVYRKDKYDGWKHVFNHHEMTHNKISYIDME